MINQNKGIIFGLIIASVAVVAVMISLEGSMFEQSSTASAVTQKTFYIATVHLDGITSSDLAAAVLNQDSARELSASFRDEKDYIYHPLCLNK